MNYDFEVPNDCSELPEQEWAEYELIEQYLDDEELMSVALACERGESYFEMLYFVNCISLAPKGTGTRRNWDFLLISSRIGLR